MAVATAGCKSGQRAGSDTRQVTIYVSTDRPFAKPVLRAYEKATAERHLRREEAKSIELANRLLPERNCPQADGFWSNEPVRTLMLKKNGVLALYKSPSAEAIPDMFKDLDEYWTGFSARMLVIAYNSSRVKPA